MKICFVLLIVKLSGSIFRDKYRKERRAVKEQRSGADTTVMLPLVHPQLHPALLHHHRHIDLLPLLKHREVSDWPGPPWDVVHGAK